jgi:hypothetical protein
MKGSCSILLAVAFGMGMSASAMAVSVGGAVAGSQGQSIAGTQVIVKDAAGHVISQGGTSASGTYDIPGLQPGNYTFTLDPGSTGYQGQTVASYVGPDGICLNWGVSTTSPAVATAQPGSACDPPAAAGWGGTAPLVGAGAAVLGAGAIAAGVAVGTSGSDKPKKSKSTGQ